VSIYYCAECCDLTDDDYEPCHEGPDNTLLCPECYIELAERAEEAIHDEDYVKPKVPFDKRQRFDDKTGRLVYDN